MANNVDFNSESFEDISNDDSEQDIPSDPKVRVKKREDSADFLQVNDPNKLLLPADKPVTFSSNTRRKKNATKSSNELQPQERKPTHMKSVSAMTTKEQSSNRHKSFLSVSNKVSERREEDEESSQKTGKLSKLKLGGRKSLEVPDDFDVKFQSSQTNNLEPPKLSNCGLMTCFIIICITNILVNVDHGCIPACTVTIKRDLNLDNASLGFLGSVVFIGLLVGSFTSPPVFHWFPIKSIILF